MDRLLVELPAEPEELLGLGRNRDMSNNALMIGQSEWLTLIWPRYGEQSSSVIQLSLPHPAGDGQGKDAYDSVRINTDKLLFSQLAGIFFDYGEPGLIAARNACRNGSVGLGERDLIESTVHLLERLVAEQLGVIEADASRLAMEEQIAVREYARAAMKQFRDAHFDGEDYKRTTRPGVRALNPLLQEARSQIVKLQNLQKEIAGRNYSDGASRDRIKRTRKRDGYRRVWLKQFLDPQAATLDQQIDTRMKIGTIWPEAVLILDALEADVWDLPPSDAPDGSPISTKGRKTELKYQTLTYNALEKLAQQADAQIAQLGRPGISAVTDPFLAQSPSQRNEGLFETLTGILLAPLVSSADRAAAAIADANTSPTGGTARSQNKVEALEKLQNAIRGTLGSGPLLLRLAEDPLCVAAGSFREAVLLHYHVYLENNICEQMAEQAEQEAMWKQLQLVSAIGGLLFTAITLPFGSAPALPAALALLRTAVTYGLFATGVALTVRSISATLGAIAGADAHVKAKLLELGQTDPDALYELGSLIAKNRELAEDMPVELLKSLGDMAGRGALRPLDIALELRDYYDDIDLICDLLTEEADDGE